MLSTVAIATLAGCCTKCPTPYNGFTIYDKLPAIKLKGRLSSNKDLRASLKEVVEKVRVQNLIIDTYEEDIANYKTYMKMENVE